jgi:hypothetical protein
LFNGRSGGCSQRSGGHSQGGQELREIVSISSQGDQEIRRDRSIIHREIKDIKEIKEDEWLWVSPLLPSLISCSPCESDQVQYLCDLLISL